MLAIDRKSRARGTLSLLAVALLLSSGPAWAQGPPAAQVRYSVAREQAIRRALTLPGTVEPRTSTTIAIECDWMGQCDFQVDGVSSPPDDCWRREIAVPRLCSLAALLYDAMEAQLDTLTIYQKFTE